MIRLGKAFKENWNQADKYGRIVATADAWLNGREYLNEKGVTPTTKAGILSESSNTKTTTEKPCWFGEMAKYASPGVKRVDLYSADAATYAAQTSVLWQVDRL